MSEKFRTALVTGGAGFIGSHLVDHLLESGLGVVVIDNFRNGRRENLPDESEVQNLKIIHGDITDPQTCRMACRDVDTVFHLACLGVRHSIHNPVENHQVNATGTLNVLNAAREAGVKRFVYSSTSEVYGGTKVFPITELTPTWPLTVYGASKLAGEHYARAFSHCYEMPTICIRPFNNYGTRSHFEGDAGEVIPRFILAALAGQPLVIFGDGEQTRDFLHVGDCVRAMLKISQCDDLFGEVVNLGFGKEVTINDLARAVVEAVGRPDLEVVHEPPRPADVPRLWADSTKLRKFVEFEPRMQISEGIGECLHYFKRLYEQDPNLLREIKVKNWEA